MENLPADLVSRIKVYDKRSEMEKFMGIKTGEENYVLDLQTKKEFNGTLMTSVAAGKGNNKKKEAELISNFFKTGGENLSVIAKSGNRNMTSANKDNRQDNVAVNFLKKFGKKIHLNGNVMYSNAINGNEGTSYYEQYLKTGNRYRYATSDRHNTNRMASTMLSMKWNIDKMTLLNLSGSFSAMKGTNGSDSRQATYNENPELDITAPFNGEENGQTENDIRVNGIRMNSRSTSANRQYFLNADLTRRLNEKGSSLGLTMQYSEGRGKNEAFSVSSTTYYQLQDEWGNDSVLYRNQYYDSPNRNRKFSLGLILTQPLHKSLRAQLSYKFRRENQNNDRNTYDLSRFFDGTDDEPLYTLPEGYEAAYTDSLSNRSRSHTTAHEVALHLNYTDRTWEINAGLSVVPERQSLDQKTGRMQADTLRTSVNYYPAVTVLWHKKKTRVQLSYEGDTKQPGLTELLTLTDNSDPLNITRGNPSLRPSYNQRVRLEARDTKIGLNGDMTWANTVNSVTRAVTYNTQTGGIESYPVNVNGNWNARATVRYQKRIKRRFSVTARTGASFSQNVSLINEGQQEMPERSTTHNTTLNANLRFGYQPQWGGFDLTGDWRFRHSTNLLRETGDYTRDYRLGVNAYADLPGDVKKGDTILLDDGLVRLTVLETSETEIRCRVENDGDMRNHKGVNVPGVRLNMPYMSQQDREDILFGAEQGFDFVAASFVRSAADVRELRKLLESRKSRIRIIAKIENRTRPMTAGEMAAPSEAAAKVVLEGLQELPQSAVAWGQDEVESFVDFDVQAALSSLTFAPRTEVPRGISSDGIADQETKDALVADIFDVTDTDSNETSESLQNSGPATVADAITDLADHLTASEDEVAESSDELDTDTAAEDSADADTADLQRTLESIDALMNPTDATKAELPIEKFYSKTAVRDTRRVGS